MNEASTQIFLIKYASPDPSGCARKDEKHAGMPIVCGRGHAVHSMIPRKALWIVLGRNG